MIIIYWFSWQFYEGFAVVKSSESSGEDSGSGGGGVGSYHKWFIRAVAKWLDMALSKADILFPKHACSILRQSSNPVCGFSLMEQVRLSAVWPMESWLGSFFNQIQGWITV